MSSLIQELENNEALLLMYLTGELPPEDRAEVEQMLANDPGLRTHLVQLQEAYDGAMDALARLDQDGSAIAGENHAVRQASRAMKQWQVDRLNRQPVVINPVRSKVPIWAYPIGVAAMLVIGALIWWGGQGAGIDPGKLVLNGGTPGSPSVQIDAPVSSDDLAKANALESGFKRELTSEITDAEAQANSLIARSDNASVAPSIFLSEENQ